MAKVMSAIAEACLSNEKLRALLQTLASRDRPRAITDMRRLRQEVTKERGIILTGVEMRDIGRLLERAGAGKLQRGKNAADPDRFTWKNNYIDFSKEVLAELEGSPDQPRRAYMAADHAQASATIKLPVPVRGQILHFEIFPDLTKDELDDIVTLLKRYTR